MNVAQAINANHRREQMRKLRQMSDEIRRLYTKMPFCHICGTRLCDKPREHLEAR